VSLFISAVVAYTTNPSRRIEMNVYRYVRVGGLDVVADALSLLAVCT
jgi:hypothetical protein